MGNDEYALLGHESINVVWNKGSEGFYLTNPAQAFSAIQSIFYYDLGTRKVSIIKESRPHAIYPIDMISKDTLLVYSTEFDTLAYYKMSLDGDYINFVKNQNLETIIEDNLGQRGFFDEEYNTSNNLITASYLNRKEFDGYKIIITNLTGTIFKEFTNGQFRNTNPTCTNDGNIIFTEKSNRMYDQIESELKIIDLETGEIRPFFSKREYPEITGIGTSDQ